MREYEFVIKSEDFDESLQIEVVHHAVSPESPFEQEVYELTCKSLGTEPRNVSREAVKKALINDVLPQVTRCWNNVNRPTLNLVPKEDIYR